MTTTLDRLAQDIARHGMASPSGIVVGEVTGALQLAAAPAPTSAGGAVAAAVAARAGMRAA